MRVNFLPSIDATLNRGKAALLSNLTGMLNRQIECKRIARIGWLLRVESSAEIASYLIHAQRSDGGWVDVEETIWCSKLLTNLGAEYRSQTQNAISWIQSIQDPLGGWGLTSRDTARIPTTSLALTLLPQLTPKSAFSWLEDEWAKDLQAEIKLTYKGGFTLMAFGNNSIQPQNRDLIALTINYLSNEQNDDGGFGPWKNHPIGSDPWSTGITLVGLTSYPELVDKKVIERAVDWLCDNQLPSGYWRYHFIDEGSAYAYWGLTKALKFLGEI